jgi:hypothetical protein
MTRLKIESDFKDFYDELSDQNSIITYKRFLSDSMQRGKALKYLRSIGIKTVEIRQVNTFIRDDSPIVVYTNPKGHNGTGKKLMNVDEAIRSYENYMGCKYLDFTSGVTIKYLQIGKRGFNLQFVKEGKSLEMGRLTQVNEVKCNYNWSIRLPIFSIDYVSDGTSMVATDFNEVENLASLGMDRYISADDVLLEIRNALIRYNKI